MKGFPVRPLSFGQQRLWFLDQLEGPSATYNVPFPLRLRGRLDRRALRQAIVDVLGRHEVLRTVIPVDGGVPGQQVLSTVDAIERLIFDVRSGDDLAETIARPFDLAADLPLRVTLFELGPDEHILLLVLHHIACDGWSLGPLGRDLASAYTARLDGEAPDWEPLPVQYLDFSEWQREVLGTEDDPDSLLSAQLAYWTERLAGIPERMVLPAHRTGGTTGAAGLVEIDIPADLHARLVAVTRAARCTPFMGLQAALAALLHRWGAGDDIVLGTPVAGRGEEALEDLVGFFVNTLVLRTDLSGDPGFAELLARVRDTGLDAYAHQDVPFDRLVDRLGSQAGPRTRCSRSWSSSSTTTGRRSPCPASTSSRFPWTWRPPSSTSAWSSPSTRTASRASSSTPWTCSRSALWTRWRPCSCVCSTSRCPIRTVHSGPWNSRKSKLSRRKPLPRPRR